MHLDFHIHYHRFLNERHNFYLEEFRILKKDIFLHVSALEESKLRVLKEEQKISYDIREEKDKLQAINIKKK